MLLTDVEQFEIVVLNPNELKSWPDASVDLTKLSEMQRLPRGVKMNLRVNNNEYEWLFSLLNTDFLLQEDKTP